MKKVAEGPARVKGECVITLDELAVQRFWANVGKGNGRRGALSGSPHPGGFWDRANQEGGPDACWPWRPTRRTGGGYGSVEVNGRPMGAHRRAYELSFGPIPDGLWVLHKCDNPPCVNPAHLFLGTNADNVADRTAKGRTVSVRGPRPGSGRKLSRTVVDDIRELLRQGETCGGIARQYGMSRQAISSIKNGHAWVDPVARPPRPSLPRKRSATANFAEDLYKILGLHPWSTVSELAAMANVDITDTRMALRYLQGKTCKCKPTDRPVRIQCVGGRKWRRYAVVGIARPANASTREAA